MQKLNSPTKWTEITVVRTKLGQEQQYIRDHFNSALLFRSIINHTWASSHSQTQTHRSWLNMTETCGATSLVLVRPESGALQSSLCKARTICGCPTNEFFVEIQPQKDWKGTSFAFSAIRDALAQKMIFQPLTLLP